MSWELFPTDCDFLMIMTIPIIIIYIILLLLIHFGLGFSLFNPCKKDKEECYNKVLYYSIYIILPLLISFIISFIIYHLLCYFNSSEPLYKLHKNIMWS